MIKYLGSKRTLIPEIISAVSSLERDCSVIDLFSGTSRVGYALKANGYQVFSNDLNCYAYLIAKAIVETDSSVAKEAQEYIDMLNSLDPEPGYFTKTYSQESMFFQPHNGAKIDAIRNHIETLDIDDNMKALLIVSLILAADKVDSTCGVQMAYLKKWAKRSYNDIFLKLPPLLPSQPSKASKAYNQDAIKLSKNLSADIAYLDPPYNQHSYLGNYHIWESLALLDNPEVYGVAKKRIDVKENKSDFNSKVKIASALKAIVENIDANHIVLSFNNEGYLTKDQILEILSLRGEPLVYEHDYKRYIGARIGIHNQSGDKVGSVSHTTNKEYIFVVSNTNQ